LQGCIDRNNRVIVIPLGLPGHANLLIYRPLLRTVERFEPHGGAFQLNPQGETEVNVNAHLKKLFEERLTTYIGPVTYIPPSETCPVIRGKKWGLQKYEGDLKKLEHEGGGYCNIWTLIVRDMILANPEMTTLNVNDEILKHSQQNPTYLSRLVRGYVVLLEKELDRLVKLARILYNKVEGASGSFKFRDVSILRNGKSDKLNREKVIDAHRDIITEFFTKEKPNLTDWLLNVQLNLYNTTPALNDSDYNDSD